VDVRDTADCWLRVCVPLLHSLTLPAGTTIALLYYCTPLLHYYYTTTLLLHTALLYYCTTTAHCTTALLHYRISLHYCTTALPHYCTALIHCTTLLSTLLICFTTPLHYCTALLLHYSTTLLHYCTQVFTTHSMSYCTTGMYHRLHTDASHPISFLTHSLSSSPSEPVMTLRYPYALDNTHTHPLTHTFRELTCELCRQFYECGWVTGTGGSISIRYGTRVYMTPSGVPKERIQPDEVFLLDLTGAILTRPSQKVASKVPKLTDCAPLFFHAYRLRNAGM
jgi:hypothetical protein